ncbi:MAG: hypothetical protein K6E98_13395 [Lachnospiraceae bacterium]|nr:hypothetical protein [Lachnospiraceae bacterium]
MLNKNNISIKEAIEILENGYYGAYLYLKKRNYLHDNENKFYCDMFELKDWYDEALKVACDCMKECLLMENDWK